MPALALRPEVRAGVLVALATLVVYVGTLYPDVPGGDSGELIGAVASHGAIHPPGYPLYALLGRAFLCIPHGSLAWRMNLASAVCDALAAGMLSVAVGRWTRSTSGGVTAGLLFAFAPGVWLYAISAEVFALNNLFVALLLLLAVLYRDLRDRRLAYAGALATGLALSNHFTILFVAAPLAAWVLGSGREELLRPRAAAALLSLFVVGLAPYLLLVVGVRADATVSWGVTDSWSGFWNHVLRRDYGALQLGGSESSRLSSGTFLAWADDLRGELGWFGATLALAGAALSMAPPKNRGLAVAVASAPILAVLVFSLLWGLPTTDDLHRQILARFWQEPDIVLFAWCGWAIAAIGTRTPPAVSPLLAGALGAAALASNLRAMDHHDDRIVRAYGAEILRAAPPRAVLFTKGDLITNTTRYLQLAEGVRADVRVVDQELLGYAWYARRVAEANPDIHLPGARYTPGAPDGFFMKQLLDANYGQWPILTCGGVKERDLTADKTYGRWPFGFCEEVHRGTEPVNLDQWLAESDAALPRIAFGSSARPPGSWESIAWGDYWQVRVNRGVQLLNVVGAEPARRHYLATAATLFQDVLDANPSVGPDAYKDLVVAIGRQGLATAEDRARQIRALQGYLDVAPANDVGRAGFERELTRLRSL
jgi:hypothetical protein